MLAPLGLHVDVHGRGRVVAQTPGALSLLEADQKVRLELTPSGPGPLVLARAAGRPRPEPARDGETTVALPERGDSAGGR